MKSLTWILFALLALVAQSAVAQTFTLEVNDAGAPDGIYTPGEPVHFNLRLDLPSDLTDLRVVLPKPAQLIRRTGGSTFGSTLPTFSLCQSTADAAGNLIVQCGASVPAGSYVIQNGLWQLTTGLPACLTAIPMQGELSATELPATIRSRDFDTGAASSSISPVVHNFSASTTITFEDSAGGDGDGVIEPGERVSITVFLDTGTLTGSTTPVSWETGGIRNASLVPGSVSVSPSGTVLEGNGAGAQNARVSVGAVGAGRWTMAFDVDVGSSLSPPQVLDLNATLIASCSSSSGPDDDDIVAIAAAPILGVTKSTTATSVRPGDLVLYTVAFGNTGNQDAANVVLEETVPQHTTFAPGSSDAWSCAGGGVAGSRCTFSAGTLQAGTARFATFAVRVDATVPSGATEIRNVVVLGGETDTVTTPVVASPQIEVTKSTTVSSVSPGGVLVYSITVSNVGDEDALGVELAETVPASAVFVPGSSDGRWSCAGGGVAGSVCSLGHGPMSAGGSETVAFTVRVEDPVPAGVTEIRNVVLAREASGTTDIAEVTTPVVAAPILGVTKSTTATSVRPGDLLLYTVAYGNTGNQDAANVVLEETVPQHTTFAPGSSDAWSCAGGGVAGSRCTFSAGTLQAGTARFATFAVRVAATVSSGATEIRNVVVLGGETDTVTTPVVAAPQIEVTKSTTVSSVSPGGVLVYSITVSNVGDEDALGVELVETVPASAVFVPGSSDGRWSCAGGGVAGSVCSLGHGPMSAGGSETVAFAVRVEDPAPAGLTEIRNVVLARESTGTTDTSEVVTPVDAAPVYTVSKSMSVTSARPGEVVVYRIDFGNTGNQDAADVSVLETVPQHTSFVAGSSEAGWSCASGGVAGARCTLAAAMLSAGSSRFAAFAVRLADPLPAGVTEIANVVVVEGVTEVVVTPVDAAPVLDLVKTTTATSVAPGGLLFYTLAVTNSGNQDASGVVLEEIIPQHTTKVEADDGWACSPDETAFARCTLSLGTVPAGETRTGFFEVFVSHSLPAGVTSIRNVALVRHGGMEDMSEVTTPVVGGPDLEVEKDDAGAMARPGEVIAYTIRVRNLSGRGASGVLVTDAVPAETTFVAASSSAGWQCNGTTGGSTCALAVGDLDVGEEQVLSFSTEVVGSLPSGFSGVLNVVSVSDDGANGDDTNPSNNTATELTPLNAGATVDLSVAKDDGGVVAIPGDQVVYTIRYQNSGQIEATGVVLEETVPVGTRYDASTTPAWSCSPDGEAGSLCQLALGSLPGGASGTASFRVAVSNPFPLGPAEVVNTVVVRDDGASGPDPTPGNNTSTERTPIQVMPELDLLKRADVSSVEPGGLIVYELDLTNIGDAGTDGVVLEETVPEHTVYVAEESSAGWSCEATVAGARCTQTVGALPTTAGERFLFAVRVLDPLPAGASAVRNVAIARDEAGREAMAVAITPIVAGPVLEVAKTTGDLAEPGRVLVWEIAFANQGSLGASGVELVETVPLLTRFRADLSTMGWVCEGEDAGSICRYLVGDLSAGRAGQVTFAVVMDPSVGAEASFVRNVVRIEDDGDESDEDEKEVPISAAPWLEVEKTDGGLGVRPGGTIVYTISYTNTGNRDAAGVVLKETVPADTTALEGGLSVQGRWECRGSEAGSVCEAFVGALSAGASGEVPFTVRVDSDLDPSVTEIANLVEMRDDRGPGPTATEVTPVEQAGEGIHDLAVTLTSVVMDGEEIVYEVGYENLGLEVGTATVLEVRIPEGTSVDTAASDGGWFCSGASCQLAVGDLQPGAHGSVFFVVDVDPGLIGESDFAVAYFEQQAEILDDGSVTEVSYENNVARVEDTVAGGAGPPRPAEIPTISEVGLMLLVLLLGGGGSALLRRRRV